MAIRIGIAAALVAAAVVVAAIVERRNRTGQPGAVPFTADGYGVHQVVRSDFARPDAPWLVVLFSSVDCGGCVEMAAKIAVLESDSVAVVVCEYTANRALHERYAVDAVPLVVVADTDGVVRKSFLGSATATDLWAAVAEARESP